MRQLFKEYHITALIVLAAGIILAAQIQCAIEKRQHIPRRTSYLQKKGARLDKSIDLRYRLANAKLKKEYKETKQIFKMIIGLEALKLYRLYKAGYDTDVKVLPAAIKPLGQASPTSLENRPPSGGRPAHKSGGAFLKNRPPIPPRKTFVYHKAQPAKKERQ